jgi:UDP-glucose 4-epimerase
MLLFDNLTRKTIQHTDMSKHKNVSLVQGGHPGPVLVGAALKGAQIVVHAVAIAEIDIPDPA